MSGTVSIPRDIYIAYIDAAGIHSPLYEDVLGYLQGQLGLIYGSDIYLGSDSQDGQLVGIFADAIHDCSSLAVAVYNSYSPSTAQGAGLSSIVKINGIARLTATQSTVVLNVGGVFGTNITNGQARDINGNIWAMPDLVTIPASGLIAVSGTCTNAGAISATAGTITIINTPTLGWQTVSNPSNAVLGSPVESDAALRLRQGLSTQTGSTANFDAVVSGVENLPGVTRTAAYENATNVTDSNGQPPHSIALVVEGGDPVAIANEIANLKAPGAATYGTTTETIIDAYNVPHLIKFYIPSDVPITVAISLHALSGYTTAIGTEIQTAVSTYLNTLPIGESVLLSRVYAAASLYLAQPDSNTFNVKSIGLSRSGAKLASADVTILFNEVTTCALANVTLVLI